MSANRPSLARRGRWAAAVAGAVALGAIGVPGACDDDAGPTPSDDGAPVRAVGGGELRLEDVDGTVDATDVDASGLVAMAVDSGGALWLLHETGQAYRATPDGDLAPAGRGATAPIHAVAAVALGPDDELVVVTDRYAGVGRLDTADPDARWEQSDIAGLPDRAVLTGLAVAPDGTLYLADGTTGTIYSVGDDDRAVPVPGTPGPDCQGRSGGIPLGLDLGDPDDGTGPVVANPTCPTYAAGGDAVAQPPLLGGPACPDYPWAVTGTGSRDGVLLAVPGIPDCRGVWQAPADAGEPTELVDGTDLAGSPRSLTTTDDTIYVLDDNGVLTVTARL